MHPRSLLAALTVAGVWLSPTRGSAQRGPAGGIVAGAARTPADPLAVSPDELAERRRALADALGDSAAVIVALGAREPSADYLGFEQRPAFLWLTGFREPDAALVLVKRPGGVTGTLFVQPGDPAREVWSGRRAGPTGARARTGIDARPVGELRATLDSLVATGLPVAIVGELRGGETPTADDALVARLRRARPDLRVVPAEGLVTRLRARKSAGELARIREAVAVTVQAHREAMRLIAPGLNEFEAQALIEYTFRRNGADRPSFATVVGSGPNATTLHYGDDDRVMQAGELVVLDIGASYAGYAADVTRTLPVSGRFTPAQRTVYQLVRDAQAAAERAARPGASWMAVSDSASRTLAAGLARLGLTEAPDATYDCAPGRSCPQLSLYYMHGLGHGLGLEVHDPAQFYFTGTLQPGDAFTLEPGIYVRANLLELLPDTPRNARLKQAIGAAVQRYANVGVRIEDDYLVGAANVEWISRAPREADEVEAAMRAPWRGPAPRDTSRVRSYRRR